MHKGQVSFDLIFAVIVFVLVYNGLNVFAENMTQDQTVASILKQEEAILRDLAITLNNATVLDSGGGNGSVTYTIPKIYAGNLGEVDCTISLLPPMVTGPEIRITVNKEDAGSEEDLIFWEKISDKMANILIDSGISNNFSCGEEITLVIV